MQFERIEAPPDLKKIIECYWVVMGNDPAPVLQKIIPDGFPEIIFHFGEPYQIKLSNTWETQSLSLVAGQISKHFYLKNTGHSDILGVKLKPAAFARLVNISMHTLRDKVVDLQSISNEALQRLNKKIRSVNQHAERINLANEHFSVLSCSSNEDAGLNKAIESIFTSHGKVPIKEICNLCGITERQLQRLFKKYIGLSPKFYTRVVRFSHIFSVAQKAKLKWSEIGLDTGFYDQSHFIRNFKAFTGEDPTKYFFDEPNLANFFLKKP